MSSLLTIILALIIDSFFGVNGLVVGDLIGSEFIEPDFLHGSTPVDQSTLKSLMLANNSSPIRLTSVVAMLVCFSGKGLSKGKRSYYPFWLVLSFPALYAAVLLAFFHSGVLSLVQLNYQSL